MIRHLFTLIWNRRRANFLLITEIFLAFVVLFVVGSLLVYHARNYRTPLGFGYEQVWRLNLDPGTQPWAGRLATGRQVMARLRAMPEVVAVGRTSSNTPFSGSTNGSDVGIGKERKNSVESVSGHRMEDDLREVLELELVAGRWFDKRDDAANLRPAVISRDLGEALFPGQSALGKTVGRNEEEYRVVGLFERFRADGALDETRPAILMRISPQDTSLNDASAVLLRVRPGAGAVLERQMNREILAIAKGWSVGITTMSEQRAAQLKRTLTPIVALVIVCLFLIGNVALGLFGVLWQTIQQRQAEIGVRRAMGATAGAISAQVVGEILVVTTFGLLLGLLVASRASSPDAAQAAIAGGQAAMAQAQLNFSRDMEREADRSGLALLADAGYAPAGMPAMFDKLNASSRHNDSGGLPYLRSHPLTIDRIGEARQNVQATGAAAAPPPAPLLHSLMQGRARVLMDPSATALRRLQDFDARANQAEFSLADRLAALYTSALASGLLRDFARADGAIAAAQSLLAAAPQPLAQDAPTRRELARLALQLALARGDMAGATRALDAATAGDDSRASLLLQADWALAEGSPLTIKRSAEALQTWVSGRRDDALAWQLLGQTATRQGQPLRAVRAEAESEAALGNLAGAIDRLRAGQRLARQGGASIDFIDVSVIDARLRDLLAQRRQLIADERKAGERPRDEKPE